MVSHTRSNLLMSIVLAMLMIGTALAMVPVQVRGENEPDLTLESSDIHFSDNEPESGDNITIYATIHNDGDGNASDILVLFRDHSHGEGNVTTIGNRTIRFLGSGEQENVSIVWKADPAGNHTIKVLIDPEESIKESNEENNNAGKNIVVKEGGGGEEKTILQGYTKEKSNGTHIPDVKVTIEKGPHQWYTYSDGDAYYEFEQEEGGNYTVYAEKEGYLDYQETVHLQFGTETTHHIRMEREDNNETWIHGYIFEKERGGTPIYDATVTIIELSCYCTYQTYSDEEGYYKDKLTEGGNYSVKVKKEGYESQTKELVITEGEWNRLDFFLEEDSGENKTIIWGYTKEQTRGAIIAYVNITISDVMGNHTNTTTSGADGYYEFELEEGGTYHVEAEKPGYEVFSGNVSVLEGGTTTYNIHLEKTATGSPWIIGYVKDMDTRSPISQATISVTGLECNCSYTTLTNQDGYYEIELDLAGNYTVRVEKEGYKSQSVKAFAAEGSEEYMGFYLEKTGTRLKGHVREGETREGGIKDVKIRIESANSSHTVFTDLNGYYEKEISHGGEYTITASKEGYLSQTKSITIDQGEEKIVDFYLEPDLPEKPAKERFQVQLTASKYKLDLEGKNRTIVSLTIENTGLEGDSYTLTATGTYKGWKITWDYEDIITIAPGKSFVMNMTLSEDLVESPDGDTIVVEVVVRSETYAEVYDSVRIEGKLEETNGIPDLTIPLIAASITVGALVASFRRRF